MDESSARGRALACVIALSAVCLPALAAPAPAVHQGVFSVVHAFSGADGSCPYGQLVRGADGAWYGSTQSGGLHGGGTVFRLTRSGRLQTLHQFGRAGDSVAPSGVVFGSDGNLYGATFGFVGHGPTVAGIVYRLAIDRSFAVLHAFDPGARGNPIIEGQDGALYGTTAGVDTAYRLALDGSYALLHTFGTDFFDPHGPVGSLAEGAPGVFYGTTSYGGSAADGSLFQVDADTTFAVLHEFGVGDDGASPFGGPIVAPDGRVEGTTIYGGVGNGTLYAADASGAEITLHAFAGDGREGFFPEAGVTASPRGALFGTTTRYRQGADLNTSGAIYRFQGGVLDVLHIFAPDGSEGLADQSPLALSGTGDLLGVSCAGGPSGAGTIYRIQATAPDVR